MENKPNKPKVDTMVPIQENNVVLEIPKKRKKCGEKQNVKKIMYTYG